MNRSRPRTHAPPLALDDRAEARRKLDETIALIKHTGKPSEPHVPDWDDCQRPECVGVFHKGEIVGYHRRNAEIERLESEIG